MTVAEISAFYSSPLGVLRISGADDFITEVHYMDKMSVGHSEEYAVSASTPAVIQQCVGQLVEYFQGKRKAFDIPIRQQGTTFQQKVWNELVTIPFGRTISYLELAKRLGDPKVIRAAASTNGKNNIAIIVPCHRVIGSKNDLIGYGGGLWRKKWLLDQEARLTYGIQTLF